VSAPGSLASFTVLICPSGCALQDVSAPGLLPFFWHLDPSLPLSPTGCECPLSFAFLLYHDLSYPLGRQLVSASGFPALYRRFELLSLPCARQRVSTLFFLTLCLCHDLSLPLRATESTCPFFRWFAFAALTRLSICTLQLVSTSLTRFYFSALTNPSVCSRQLVSATDSLTFNRCTDLFLRLHSTESECPRLLAHFSVLICPFVCAGQDVSAPRPLAFFCCPDFPSCLRSTGCACPSLTSFLLYPDLSLRSIECEWPLSLTLVCRRELALSMCLAESKCLPLALTLS
jgi:hypothetical protein